jgi:polar amino acid transport system substrate-binding protein
VCPRGYRGADREEKGVTDMSRTRIWIVLAFASLLAGTLIAAGCGGDDDEEAAGEPQLIKQGQLLAGIDTPFPPFEEGHPPNITGYDIDVINAVADELGLEVVQEETSFDTIFRDVAQGKFDVAVAASTILPERERTVDFSDPYYLADQSLLVAEGETDIKSQKDLGGKIVGAQDGTTGETYANDETDAAEVRGYPGGTDAITALRTGQIDAVIVDSPVAEDAVQKQGGVEIAEKIVTRELYGFSFAPENDALRENVNEALTTLKENGTITDLYKKYFPDQSPDPVLNATHEPS